MFGKYLAFVVGLVVLVIAFVPRGGDPLAGGGGPGPEDSTAKLMVAGSQEVTDWNAGGHSLARARDGHFYADAIVDGTPVQMMVDTGASVIALTASDAAAAGLSWDDSEVVPIGTGASGTVYGLPARLDEVEIGGIVRRDVRAVVIPEGLEVSLLGQSWLAQVNSVEIVDDRMVLSAD